MNYQDFMHRVQRNDIPHVVVLSGEERYFIDKALKYLCQKLSDGSPDAIEKLPASIGEEELVNRLETVPFLMPKNVFVIEDAPFFSQKGKANSDESKDSGKFELLQEEISSMPEFSFVVFVVDGKMDKRKKLAKTAEKVGLVLEAEPIRPWNFDKWLQPKLRSINKVLDKDAYAYLTKAVSLLQNVPLSYLNSEFDKLTLFAEGQSTTKNEIVDVFSGLPDVSLFAITDAISAKDAKKALVVLHRQLKDGTYFAPILTLLDRHVRQLWQARILRAKGEQDKEIAKAIGLHPFVAKKIADAAQSFNDEQLKQALIHISDADYAMKTGNGGDEMLEGIVINLCA